MLYCTFCKYVEHNLYNDNQCTLMVVMKCANAHVLFENAVYILDEVHVYIA